MLRVERDFYNFLQNLEAIKYNKCQDAPLGGQRGHGPAEKVMDVRWQSPDKYFTFLLHNGIFQNTFIQKKQINQNQYWQFEVTPCVYESRLARYNSFYLSHASIVRSQAHNISQVRNQTGSFLWIWTIETCKWWEGPWGRVLRTHVNDPLTSISISISCSHQSDLAVIYKAALVRP